MSKPGEPDYHREGYHREYYHRTRARRLWLKKLWRVYGEDDGANRLHILGLPVPQVFDKQEGSSMQRQPVESTNIASVGFDQEHKIMEIEFRGGGIYQYTGITVEKHWRDLMAAESKGKYFTAHVRRDPQLQVKKVG